MHGENIIGKNLRLCFAVDFACTEEVEHSPAETGTEDRSGVLDSHVSLHLFESVCLLGFLDADFVDHKLVDRRFLIFFLFCHGC